MGSLNKVKSVDEIKQWLKSNNIPDNELLVVTPKYDGISLVVNESEDKAWTRGDGEVGQMSDDHFAKMNDRHCGVDLFSFGEAIMSKSNFQKYKDKFANPRNMVAGLFNRDEAGDELKDVEFIRYGIGDLTKDKINQIGLLNSINEVNCRYLILKSEEFFELDVETIEDSLTELYKQWGEDYQIDGLVIDVNSADLRNELGREENMNPKYSRAIKFPNWSSSIEAKVTGVTWQISKQGKLKPVINIESTEVSGVTISNVTGYNAKYIFDNNIYKNSVIKIVRSGEVIPKHIKTIDFDTNEEINAKEDLNFCPCCFGETRWDETHTELICTNPECDEVKISKLIHFFQIMEVEDFGEPSIRSFYRAGFKDIQAILNMSVETIMKIPGFGLKNANTLQDQFERVMLRGTPLAKILHALDLFEGKIGEKTIQHILDNMGGESFDFRAMAENIESRYKVSYISKLIEINGVAEKIAVIFQIGLCEFYRDNFHKLPISISYIKTQKEEVTGSKYEGWKICFTGCRPTKDQEKYIQTNGGEIVGGVSKNTTHLVVKDSSSTSSKIQKAKQLNIKIIQFVDLWK
jgi:NAD-dependent DNA ligase